MIFEYTNIHTSDFKFKQPKMNTYRSNWNQRAYQCIYGHDTSQPSARFKSGSCRQCNHIRQQFKIEVARGRVTLLDNQTLNINEKEQVINSLPPYVKPRKLKIPPDIFCPRGHNVTKLGRTKNNKCYQCYKNHQEFSYCPQGHNKNETGRTSTGHCLICHTNKKKLVSKIKCSMGHFFDEVGKTPGGQCQLCFTLRQQEREVRNLKKKEAFKIEQTIRISLVKENKNLKEQEKQKQKEHKKVYYYRGHTRAIVGTTPSGYCRGCAKEDNNKKRVSTAPTIEEAQRRSRVLKDKRERWKQRYPERYTQQHHEKKMRRKAREYNMHREPYDYYKVVHTATHCGICGKPYQPNDRRSLDHIVPISLGGHDVPGNVQSAHLSCNSQKGPHSGRNGFHHTP